MRCTPQLLSPLLTPLLSRRKDSSEQRSWEEEMGMHVQLSPLIPHTVHKFSPIPRL